MHDFRECCAHKATRFTAISVMATAFVTPFDPSSNAPRSRNGIIAVDQVELAQRVIEREFDNVTLF